MKDSVLAIRFSALGDVAMSLPSLYDACLAMPDRQFVLLTRSRAASIFCNHPDNLTIVTPDLKSYSGPIGLLRLFRELKRDYGFSTLVDLHDVLRTKVLRFYARIAGVKVSVIRKGRSEKRALTRKHNKLLVPLTPTTERYRDTFLRASIPQPGKFRSLFPDSGADPAQFATVTAPKKEGERWIAIAPFARHAGKIYPPELMEKVVAHFAGMEGIRIFAFGFGKEEGAITSSWAAKYPAVTDMAAAGIGMAREMALISHCDVMVSMDSANMHLASLAGCPVVSIWGATHPFTGFLGWNQQPDDAVQLEMTCRPCSVFGNKPCLRGDYHCLRGITPSMVINKVEPYLNGIHANRVSEFKEN